MGDGNWVGPHCLITGNTRIGNGNRFEAFCSIGTPPEHKKYWHDMENPWGVTIGSKGHFREFITINAGTSDNTLVLDRVIMLKGAHVGHDATIGDDVTLSCNALIGGHCVIGKGTNVGLGALIHQHQEISEGCMIGMGAVVTKTLMTQCYKTYVGNPARLLGDNDKHPNYTIFMKQMHGE